MARIPIQFECPRCASWLFTVVEAEEVSVVDLECHECFHFLTEIEQEKMVDDASVQFDREKQTNRREWM